MAEPAHPVDEVLARLLALHPKLIDLSLSRIERLLARLDHPERRLPSVIHVAGTNGKGSTLAFISALATAHGLRPHLYTSPHLIRFNERIALASSPGTTPAPIGDEKLMPLLARVEAANEGEPITFFEITTALALLAFAETPSDLVLLETGLGGRVDATNVIPKPAVTVITPVGMDHMGFLGDSLAKIAGEKAGILKPGCAAVLAPQQHAAEAVLKRVANEQGAPIVPLVEPIDQETGLKGPHQQVNAQVALTAFKTFAQQQGISLDPARVAQGLRDATWPARLQPLDLTAFDAVDQPRPAWLDGAHNPEGMQALVKAWPALAGDQPFDLIMGVMANKELSGIFQPLRALADHGTLASITAVPVPDTPNGLPADDLAAACRDLMPDKVAVSAAPDFATALDVVAAKPARPLLITGSLYLAGSILAQGEKAGKRLPLIGV